MRNAFAPSDKEIEMVDGNCNVITVEETGRRLDGQPLVIVRLVGEPAKGYIALDEGTGGFGSPECPSSHGMPCMSWFGEGERFPTPEAALVAIADHAYYDAASSAAMSTDPEKVPCPTCNGRGWHDHQFRAGADCADCEGTGHVGPERASEIRESW